MVVIGCCSQGKRIQQLKITNPYSSQSAWCTDDASSDSSSIRSPQRHDDDEPDCPIDLVKAERRRTWTFFCRAPFSAGPLCDREKLCRESQAARRIPEMNPEDFNGQLEDAEASGIWNGTHMLKPLFPQNESETSIYRKHLA